MEIIAKPRKIGGSLVITLPRVVVEEEKIVVNRPIKVEIKNIKKSAFGKFKGIGPFTKEDKFKGQLEDE